MTSHKKFSRRDFVAKSAAGFASAAVSKYIPGTNVVSRAVEASFVPDRKDAVPDAFIREVEQLPEEMPYAYHKKLTGDPIHIWRRNTAYQPLSNEIALPERGWKLVCVKNNSPVLENAFQDMRDYLERSMGVIIETEAYDSLEHWQDMRNCIIAGTPDQLPGCGTTLKNAKDYELVTRPEQLVVCGYDERGIMFGLYNLEARMNFREAPFLPKNFRTVRHSRFKTRMVLSWMGWMEWPDTLLSHIAHDGYDSILASVYANPNGDRTTAEGSTDFYARHLYQIRRQDPEEVHRLIERAARYGIKVYTPIVYQYMGTPESEAGLRKLVKNIVKEFPGIQGYVLLTEGFYYKQWKAGRVDNDDQVKAWAREWCKAISIVAEECHKVNPATEILPWEYNIDFRPQKTALKRYFIQQLPAGTIPMLTWENGKSFEIDGLQGYLRDYSISEIGPAEVTQAQLKEAHERNMEVYSKVDTFASWQFGTIPYLPVPHQWFDRYKAIEEHGVNGTLETWSYGYKPNFMSELRAWTCWTDAPPMTTLLNMMAERIFGKEGASLAVKAWEYFSNAIRYLPDTGPYMGTNNAVGNPLFFREPPTRTPTYKHSWKDFGQWESGLGGGLNPYWPFTVSRMVFCPDFTNKTNKAEQYAKNVSGITVDEETKILPVFLKYLHLAADQMGKGMQLYKKAALAGPEAKRQTAVREVVVAEQMHRMIQSDAAILEFEDLRLQLSAEKNKDKKNRLLDQMEALLHEEIARTESSLLAATRDSRLGFEFEQDYVYTPYSLKEKLRVLKDVLDNQLPEARAKGV
jgi:hypothetical protein